MRCLRALLAGLLVFGLAACGPNDGGGGSTDSGGSDSGSGGGSDGGSAGGGGSSNGGSSDGGSDDGGSGGAGSTSMSYQVPNSDCPTDYPYGLTVTAEVQAEVQYLDKMPACTDADATSTWVKNDSDAVWVIQTDAPGTASQLQDGELADLAEGAFLETVQPSTAILVPSASTLVSLPPEQVRWVVSLEYSFGWAAQDFTLSRVESAAAGGAVAALRRRGSPAGATVAACALAGYEGVKGARGLSDADAQQVMVDVLGSSVAGLKCRDEARNVRTVNAGGSGLLSDELSHLGSQTELLESVHGQLDNAQRLSKAVNLLKFFKG